MRNGRLWVVLLGLLIAIPAAIVAVNTLIGQILQEVHIERQVQIQLKTAQHYQDVDDFDNALREIDKALELRPKDESIIIKQVELRTYKLAAEYDQRKLLPPREVLEDLERN